MTQQKQINRMWWSS